MAVRKIRTTTQHGAIKGKTQDIDDTVYIIGNSLKDLGHSLTTVLKTTFNPEEILEKLK